MIRRLISGHYVADGKVQYDKDNLSEKYLIKGVAYDRWNSLNLIRDLEAMAWHAIHSARDTLLCPSRPRNTRSQPLTVSLLTVETKFCSG